MHSFSNRLARETSPYLLQHAHNPVDWYPWSNEAFEKAKQEDKPVLVSIGYSACHWCHVMERESFEDPKVAAIMNAHFVNIKVDREERPDVDHTYMDAVQALSGSGGWPLNVFLTPDRKPFYGGTYFPPQRAFNRASWTEVLLSVADAYKERKEEIEKQAENLTGHLQASNSLAAGLKQEAQDASSIDRAFDMIMKTADREWGGFGNAPKFPQSFTIHFLLQYAHIKNNQAARDQALLSLDKMIRGGIYDQVGGGFARYSTDAEWLAPHFEKMLYDNALLVSTLSEAYQLTKDPIYKEAVDETLDFVERELLHESGGFYSALDADSEGEEGRFYVWDQQTVNDILGKDAEIFSAYFDISPQGNWEGNNILRVKKAARAFAEERGMDPADLGLLIQNGRKKLLDARSQRARPALDDKIILGWNALMNLAYCKAYAATGYNPYKKMAEANMAFLLSSFESAGSWSHTWKNGQARHPAFLDDYSYLIAALIELAQVTADYSYLDRAAELAQTVVENFSDEAAVLFYYTARHQSDVLVRKKEIYDGATPSGNSVMAYNLYRLSILLDRPEWRGRAGQMVSSMGDLVTKYPTSFGIWLSLLFEMTHGTTEIAVVGKDWENYLGKLLGIYISHKLAQASAVPSPKYPLLSNKPEAGETRIYLCENYACQQPVTTIQDFLSLIQRK
jgi:uncharacterized protein YyaL (SSP411 family)